MPYITQYSREFIDPILMEIKSIMYRNVYRKDGHISSDAINIIFRHIIMDELIKKLYIDDGKLNYDRINRVIGVISCISREFEDKFENPYYQKSFIQSLKNIWIDFFDCDRNPNHEDMVEIYRTNDDMLLDLSKQLMKSDKNGVVNLEGNFNYTITKIIKMLYVDDGKFNSQRIEHVNRILTEVADEFYAKVARPYEDKKEQENGKV